MKPQGRLGDKSFVPIDAHGCPACPHPANGPAIQGSPNVLVNGRPAIRVGDNGIHMACCGPNMWKAVSGSATVFINGKPAHRMGDQDRHCGGSGKLIQGSSNVLVGDSGAGGGGAGRECNLAIMRKKAAEKGTPFIEKIKTALQTAQEAASEIAEQAIGSFSDLIEKGKQNSEEAAHKKDKSLKLKESAFNAESKKGYIESKNKIGVSVDINKKLYDDEWLYYGNENANVKISHADADLKFGYSHDVEKGEHNFTLFQLKGKYAVVDAKAHGKAAKGLLEGEVKAEALSIAGELTLPTLTVRPGKAEVKAKLGGEANLIKGEAKGQVNITPKTIYDNTIGGVVGWFSPDSKYTSAPKWLDHGVVIGAKGEAGIGAAAEIEGAAGVKDGVYFIEGGAKAGAGPMAGLKVFLGIK